MKKEKQKKMSLVSQLFSAATQCEPLPFQAQPITLENHLCYMLPPPALWVAYPDDNIWHMMQMYWVVLQVAENRKRRLSGK